MRLLPPLRTVHVSFPAHGSSLCKGQLSDPDALAGAVVKLMKEDDARRALARRSLAAAPRHSREHQARLTIEVLELAAAARGDEAGRTVGP